jgi:polysaccharide export outer membrane protein
LETLPGRRRDLFVSSACTAVILLAIITGVTGCQTTPEIPAAQFSDIVTNQTAPPIVSETFVLHEGDSVRVSFPGAPNLNTVVTIRRDGKITLPIIGEFQAAGLTPTAMEKELVKQYGSQLQTKEVNVAVESSAFYVYVTGSVLRPGKVISDRPMTALEAIMEAGGFDYTKANMKKVVVIRHENGATQHQLLNLKKVLHGEQDQPFSLKRSDIIYVPEKFAWF